MTKAPRGIDLSADLAVSVRARHVVEGAAKPSPKDSLHIMGDTYYFVDTETMTLRIETFEAIVLEIRVAG